MTTKNVKIIDDIVIANIDNNQYPANNDNNIINSNENTDENTNKNTDENTKKRGRKKKIIINNEEDTIVSSSVINNSNIELKLPNVAESKNDKLIPKKSNDFLKELLLRQLPNVNISKKLTYNDIKRISKFIVSSIFDENECSIWNGYITNEKNQVKGTYINFYFNQKKIALHRLLYLNFIGDILNTEYIKFSCVNKGKCCNIHHMKKYSYNSNLLSHNTQEHSIDNSVHIVQNKNLLIIEL
jgi:hypothetical protein